MRKGWEIKKLGDLLQKTETVDPAKKPNVEFKYIDISSVNNETFTIENASLLKGKDAPSRARKLVRTNDVIFATVRPTLKRIAVISQDYNEQICSTGYFVLRTNKDLNSKLVFYYLQTDSFISKMEKLQRGASYPAVTDGDIKEQLFSYPKSLAEQKLIVDILDESFGAIDKAKANLEKNLQNSQEFFESYLQTVFTNKGKDWEEKKLTEIGITQTGTTPKTSEKENYGDYIPFIKPADVDFNGTGDLRYDNEGLSEIGLRKGRKMGSGSILMVCIGATIGKVGFSEKEISCNQQINSLTVRKEYEWKFFYYAMNAKDFQEKVLLEGKGAQATLPIINKSKWENLTISFPKSKTEQLALVTQFDALKKETQKLKNIYRKKMNDLEELKKCILQKGFTGELTAKALEKIFS